MVLRVVAPAPIFSTRWVEKAPKIFWPISSSGMVFFSWPSSLTQHSPSVDAKIDHYLHTSLSIIFLYTQARAFATQPPILRTPSPRALRVKKK
jgi:hypothetical protein